jgi:amino acid adenylation domain-containing protein
MLGEDFEAIVARAPDRPALVCGNERLSYSAVHSRASEIASFLKARGVQRGDRVALFLDNGAPLVAGLYATWRLGAVVMPISPLTKPDKLSYMLADAAATVVITQATLADVWARAVDRSPTVRTVMVCGGEVAADAQGRVFSWPNATGGANPRLDAPGGLIDLDLAAILYTSGSTGEPKGVMLTHLNMASASRSVIAYLGLREEDVILCALSLAHGYGLYHVLMGFSLGATVVLEPSFAFPIRILEAMARERATVLPGVPAMFARLLAISGIDRYDLGALRLLTNAAAALPERHIRQLQSNFPQARLYSMYGLTECKRVTYLPPEQLDIRPGSVGRGMPNQQHWLVDEQGNRLPHGATGELVVRGSHVMVGYWGKPEQTARRLRPGELPGERVLYTGDIFRTDEEGWLYFIGRSDDIFKSRGEKVSPREVEEAIHALDGVHEVAVIGIPDEVLGKAVKAFVVLEPGSRLMQRDIVRHCLSRLESFMVPKVVEFVEAIPKTDSGKTKKTELR